MWRGRDIPERVRVEWGKHSMVDATRALMRNGLEDPLNQKFMLLSEAGIPLYPPHVLYHQLITETKSRLMGCVTPTVCLAFACLLMHEPCLATIGRIAVICEKLIFWVFQRHCLTSCIGCQPEY